MQMQPFDQKRVFWKSSSLVGRLQRLDICQGECEIHAHITTAAAQLKPVTDAFSR